MKSVCHVIEIWLRFVFVEWQLKGGSGSDSVLRIFPPSLQSEAFTPLSIEAEEAVEDALYNGSRFIFSQMFLLENAVLSIRPSFLVHSLLSLFSTSQFLSYHLTYTSLTGLSYLYLMRRPISRSQEPLYSVWCRVHGLMMK